MKKFQKQILANQKQNLDAIYKVKALINYKLKAKEANLKQKNF